MAPPDLSLRLICSSVTLPSDPRRVPRKGRRPHSSSACIVCCVPPSRSHAPPRPSRVRSRTPLSPPTPAAALLLPSALERSTQQVRAAGREEQGGGIESHERRTVAMRTTRARRAGDEVASEALSAVRMPSILSIRATQPISHTAACVGSLSVVVFLPRVAILQSPCLPPPLLPLR